METTVPFPQQTLIFLLHCPTKNISGAKFEYNISDIYNARVISLNISNLHVLSRDSCTFILKIAATCFHMKLKLYFQFELLAR